MLVLLPSIGMNQTLNSSETPQLTLNRMNALKAAYFVFSALATLTCVFGMVGNSLVIWLLSFRMQRTPFCVYVLNLAVADLLFLICMASVISLEIVLPDKISPEIIFQDKKVKALEVMRRVKYFAYVTGLSLLTAISTQRCLSVLFPIWYKCRSPRRLSIVVCALLWALSLLMNTLATFFCSRFGSRDEPWCLTVDIVLSILILGIFTPVMMLSSMILFVRVRRSAQQWRRRPSRLFVVILASVLVFLVCSLPLGIYWFILSWVNLQSQIETLYVSMSRLSSSLGSSANPIIYLLVGRQRSWSLREPLGTVLSRVLQEEEPELEGREMSSTGTDKVGPESQSPPVSAQASPAWGISTCRAATSFCPCHAACVERCWEPQRLSTLPCWGCDPTMTSSSPSGHVSWTSPCGSALEIKCSLLV
nr:mas-related G-protein coupled receptor member D [Loxodonta africana]